MSVAVRKLEGVADVSVSLNEGLARVELESANEITLEQLRRAIRDQGFSPREATVTLAGAIERRDGRLVVVAAGSRAAFTLTGDERVLAEIERAEGATVTLRGVVAEGDATTSLAVSSVVR